MKDWQVRISETIRFIRASNLPHCVGIATILEQKNNANTIPLALSVSMSQGTLWTIVGRSQEQEYRHYRRALILIRVALLGEDTVDVVLDVNGAADNTLRTALIHALERVLTAPLNDLKNYPYSFLSATRIASGGRGNSNHFNDFCFCYESLHQRYAFRPNSGAMASPGPAMNVAVTNIAVQKSADLGVNPYSITGFLVNADDPVVTTQLTGCSVAYNIHGGQLLMAHIQPTGGLSGTALADQLRAGFTFSNSLGGGATGVFGPMIGVGDVSHDGYSLARGDVYLIGLKRGGLWEIFAQQYPRGSTSVPDYCRVAP